MNLLFSSSPHPTFGAKHLVTLAERHIGKNDAAIVLLALSGSCTCFKSSGFPCPEKPLRPGHLPAASRKVRFSWNVAKECKSQGLAGTFSHFPAVCFSQAPSAVAIDPVLRHSLMGLNKKMKKATPFLRLKSVDGCLGSLFLMLLV